MIKCVWVILHFPSSINPCVFINSFDAFSDGDSTGFAIFSNVRPGSPFWASQSAHCVSAGAGWWLGGHRSHLVHPNTSSHPGEVSQWEVVKTKRCKRRVSYKVAAATSTTRSQASWRYESVCHRRKQQEVWHRHVTSSAVAGRHVHQLLKWVSRRNCGDMVNLDVFC